MKIKLVEGLHLTGLERDALRQMIEKGLPSASTKRKRFAIYPEPGKPGEYGYHIRTSERDDWNRPVTRDSRGIFRAIP